MTDKLRGGLMAMPSLSNLNFTPRILWFQYKLGGMTREVTPNTGESKPLRFTGPPQETISLDADFDATDYMAEGEDEENGILPQLSILELMLYPGIKRVALDAVRSLLGMTEIVAPEVPLTLFIFGRRVLPIQLLDIHIEEQAFDQQLNPIRATVGLKMKVLSYNDVRTVSPSSALYLANQGFKEVMAATTVRNAASRKNFSLPI